jgi:hypothetical protein
MPRTKAAKRHHAQAFHGSRCKGCPLNDSLAAIESEARQQEREALAERIEGLPDSVPWWEPESAIGKEPDGYFLDRAAVLSILRGEKP